MRFKAGFEVQIIGPTLIPDRFNDEETIADWTQPIVVTDFEEPVPVSPVQLVDSPMLDQPDRLSDRLQALLPYGTVVDPTHRVKVLTGPYTGTYTIDGKVGHWLNPFTGWPAGSVVILEGPI